MSETRIWKAALAVAASALGSVPLLAQAIVPPNDKPSQPDDWPKTVYYCHQQVNLVGFGGTVSFEAWFKADETIMREQAQWYSNERGDPAVPAGAAIPPFQLFGAKQAGARGTVTLTWTGAGQPTDQGGSIDWNWGSARFGPFGPSSFEWRKGERWTAIYVVRDREAFATDRGSDRYLNPNFSGLMLHSDPMRPGSYGLNAPIDVLLAWGSNRDRLTVFETRAKLRKYRPNVYPNSPIGEMRIVSEYEVYPGPLAAAAAAIRREHTQWRAAIGDFTKTCQKQLMEDPSLILVSRPLRWLRVN